MDFQALELAIARIFGYTVVPVPHHDGALWYGLLTPEGKMRPIRRTEEKAWQDAPRFARSHSSFLPLLHHFLQLRPQVYSVNVTVWRSQCTVLVHWWLDESLPTTAGSVRLEDVSKDECGYVSVVSRMPGQALCEAMVVLEAIYGRMPVDEALALCDEFYATERLEQITKWQAQIRKG